MTNMTEQPCRRPGKDRDTVEVCIECGQVINQVDSGPDPLADFDSIRMGETV